MPRQPFNCDNFTRHLWNVLAVERYLCNPSTCRVPYLFTLTVEPVATVTSEAALRMPLKSNIGTIHLHFNPQHLYPWDTWSLERGVIQGDGMHCCLHHCLYLLLLGDHSRVTKGKRKCGVSTTWSVTTEMTPEMEGVIWMTPLCGTTWLGTLTS